MAHRAVATAVNRGCRTAVTSHTVWVPSRENSVNYGQTFKEHENKIALFCDDDVVDSKATHGSVWRCCAINIQTQVVRVLNPTKRNGFPMQECDMSTTCVAKSYASKSHSVLGFTSVMMDYASHVFLQRFGIPFSPILIERNADVNLTAIAINTVLTLGANAIRN